MAMENFECLGLLGSGSFAKVFQVRKKNGDDVNKIYALKAIEFNDADSNKQAITTEKNILSRVEHAFVVKFIDSFESKNTFYFVLEYVRGGTLADLLERTKKFDQSAASFYMKELVVGLEYLHSKKIIHGDVAARNILLDDNGHIKIADFGISIDLSSENKKCHKFAIDWFSLGAMFYYMITGSVLVRKSQWPKTLTKKEKDLLQKLLQTYPPKSLDDTAAETLKKCKYFRNTSWEKVVLRLETPPILAESQKCSL